MLSILTEVITRHQTLCSLHLSSTLLFLSGKFDFPWNNARVVTDIQYFFSYAKGVDIQSGLVVPSLFKMDPPNQIIIDTVKLAEDDNDKGKQVILRLYEAYGGRSTAVLNR